MNTETVTMTRQELSDLMVSAALAGRNAEHLPAYQITTRDDMAVHLRTYPALELAVIAPPQECNRCGTTWYDPDCSTCAPIEAAKPAPPPPLTPAQMDAIVAALNAGADPDTLEI